MELLPEKCKTSVDAEKKFLKEIFDSPRIDSILHEWMFVKESF